MALRALRVVLHNTAFVTLCLATTKPKASVAIAVIDQAVARCRHASSGTLKRTYMRCSKVGVGIVGVEQFNSCPTNPSVVLACIHIRAPRAGSMNPALAGTSMKAAAGKAPCHLAQCVTARCKAGCSIRHKLWHRRSLVCCSSHKFVLYSKPDCPLCDGLKDKMVALIDRAQFLPSLLTDAELEVRDISTNDAWCQQHAGSIPVLAVLAQNQQEVVLPRPPPRITADRLQRHLEEALQQLPDTQPATQ